MGLLGDFEDPKTQGLLSLGLGLLNSRGNFGQGLGQAGMQAMEVMRQARADQDKNKQQAMQQALWQAQIADTNAQATQRQQQALKLQKAQEMAMSLMGGGGQVAPPASMPSMMPGSGQRTPEQNSAAQSAVQSPPQQPKSSQLSRLNEDQITGLIASGALPEKAYDIWKFSKVGEQMQPGYQRMPDGRLIYNPDPVKGITLGPNGQVQVMPGAAAAQSTLAAANELPKSLIQSGTKREDFTNPDGTTRSMSGLQFLGQSGGLDALGQWLNGGAGQAPQQPPQQSPVRPMIPQRGQPGTSVPPDVQSSRDSERMTILKAERAKATSPEDIAALDREISRAGGITSGVSNQAKIGNEAQGKINDTWLKSSYEPAVAAGSTARDAIAAVKTARFALADLGDTGFGTGAKQAAARVLGAVGVPNAEQYAANGAIFQKAAGDRLFTLLGEQKGPQTEGDADRGKQLFASITIPKQANQFILDTIEAKAEWDQRRAKYFQEALPFAREKGDLQEVDRRWQRIAPSVFDLPSMQKWKARLK